MYVEVIVIIYNFQNLFLIISCEGLYFVCKTVEVF